MQLATELTAAQLRLGQTDQIARKVQSLERELSRLEGRLAKEAETNKRLVSENGDLDSQINQLATELRHVREEGDRLSKILKQAAEDSDALGL